MTSIATEAPKNRITGSSQAILLPLLPLVGFWLLLIYNLGAQWSVYEQYNYGWAVPFLCAYLIWKKVGQRVPPATEQIRNQKSEIRNQDLDKVEQRVSPATEEIRNQKLEIRNQDLNKVGQCVPPATEEIRNQKLEIGNQHLDKVEQRVPPASAEVRNQESGISELRNFIVSLFQLFRRRSQRGVDGGDRRDACPTLLAFCLLAYALTRWLHEANPIWRLTSWLWALEVVAITLLVLRLGESSSRIDRSTLHAPSSPLRSPISTFRFQLSDFVIPIAFFLVAVPWPSGIETFLTQTFQRWDVAVTTELLELFGIPAVQHGSVIEIGSGMVGVDEACSGIRSFQATLMISIFLGELYSLTVLRRVLCVLVGFTLAFIFNVGRTFLLVAVASAQGINAISSWHDPAGTAILVCCFLSIWFLAMRLSTKVERRKQKADISAFQNFSVSAFRISSILNPLSSTLLVWLLAVEAGTEFWYRWHESPKHRNTETSAYSSRNWSVGSASEISGFKTVSLPPGIANQFRADQNVQAHWKDESGHPWQLYYFRWTPGHSLKKRVTTQLAKTHGPEKCLTATGMALQWVRPIHLKIRDLPVTIQQHLFLADGKPVYVFYGIYEDATGTETLANRRQNTRSRLAAALAGSRNYGQRFLELAVWGYDRQEDSLAAFQQQLSKIITTDGSGSGQ